MSTCDPQLIITEDVTELLITKEDVAFLEVEATGLPGAPGLDSPGIGPMAFSRMGTQFVSTGDQRFYVEYPGQALGIRAVLGSPPVGADFVVALKRNGTVIKTATISDGGTNSGYQTIGSGSDTILPGDYFTLDVLQVGATSPGSTLTVTFWMKVTN